MSKISQYPDAGAVQSTDQFVLARAGKNYSVLGSQVGGTYGNLFPSDGAMLNGRISVTENSSNLTVALKTLAGADPSASSPVYVRINNTIRSITSALSVTKNAGTNWGNAGGAELATKEIDWFVYLIWNTTPATDVIDIGFSRVPYFRVYSEASGTSTNEKYLAFGNASTPTSTDDVVNIGRFAATLSAGAGHTWTAPSFTTSNLLHFPIYETRWLSWQPVYSCLAPMTINTVTTSYAKYKLEGYAKLTYQLRFTGTLATGASGVVYNTAPFEFANVANGVGSGAQLWNEFGGGVGFGGTYATGGTPDLMSHIKSGFTNFALGAGFACAATGLYEI